MMYYKRIIKGLIKAGKGGDHATAPSTGSVVISKSSEHPVAAREQTGK